MSGYVCRPDVQRAGASPGPSGPVSAMWDITTTAQRRNEIYGFRNRRPPTHMFDATDTRGLAFTQRIYSPVWDPNNPDTGVNDVQSFYVNAVPLPGAAWLFASGMVGLFGAMRRTVH